MVAVPGVGGGEGVGRAASRQLRRPGVAAPLCHGDVFIRTGYGGRTAVGQTGEGQCHHAAVGQGGRGRGEGQAGGGLADGHGDGASGGSVFAGICRVKHNALDAAVSYVGKALAADKAPCSGDGLAVHCCGAGNAGVGNRTASVGHGNGIDGQIGDSHIRHGDGDRQVKCVVIGGFCYGNGDRAGFINLSIIICQLIGQHGAADGRSTHKNAVGVRSGDRPQFIALREQIL